jgi:hypothetical protein
MAGAAVGALPGVALFAVARALPGDRDFWWFIAGSAASVVGPTVGAVVGFESAPVVLVGPGGERAAGVALRVGL